MAGFSAGFPPLAGLLSDRGRAFLAIGEGKDRFFLLSDLPNYKGLSDLPNYKERFSDLPLITLKGLK